MSELLSLFVQAVKKSTEKFRWVTLDDGSFMPYQKPAPLSDPEVIAAHYGCILDDGIESMTIKRAIGPLDEQTPFSLTYRHKIIEAFQK